MAVDLALLLHGDPRFRGRIREALEAHDVDVAEVASAAEALEVVRTRGVGLLIAEVDPDRPDAIDVFRRAGRLQPSLVGIAFVSAGNAPSSSEPPIEAVFDRIDAAASVEDLRWRVGRALAQRRLLADLTRLRDDLQGRRGFQQLVGRSEPMERVRERLERLARTDASVLFVGEPGTGKKHAARTLHAWSTRADKPFLTVSCGSPDDRLESELFGHERGAVPGSDRRALGLIEQAGGGTVLLEEITLLPPRLQDRLDAALADRAFRRLGGADDIPLLARVLASSSADVERAVSDGRLREDLHRQLSAETVALPPLRARHGDLILLARSFIEEIREVNALPPIHLAPEAVTLLESHGWPGNVRELRNAVEHSVMLASDGTVRARDLPEALHRRPEAHESSVDATRRFREAKRRVVGAFERAYLQDLMQRHRGNVTAGAEHAGMLRSALQRLLRKHALRSSDFRTSRPATRSGEGT